MPVLSVSILIIADDPEVSLYLANLLRAQDYCVSSAVGVEEGLNQMRGKNISLVVLDTMLPGDSAQRIYLNLCCENGLCGIPVVLLSSFSRRALRGAGFFSSGSFHKRLPEPDEILDRPPEAEDFLTAVRRLTMNRPSFNA